MKYCFFIIILALFSCSQNQSKPPVESSKSNTLPIDTVIIDGSMSFENYIITADTSYFYTTPESGSKSNTFLLKKDLLMVYKINKEFAYSIVAVDSAGKSKGWIKLTDIEKIRFTPPKLVKE